MSTPDYIDSLSLDQLDYFIEKAKEKVKAAREQKKQECFVVSDDWLNYGHYRISDPEAALSMFNREFIRQTGKGTFESLSIKVEKYYPDEMKEIFGV